MIRHPIELLSLDFNDRLRSSIFDQVLENAGSFVSPILLNLLEVLSYEPTSFTCTLAHIVVSVG